MRDITSRAYEKRFSQTVAIQTPSLTDGDEVWKDILGYEGVYQVSNHGRIRSLDRYVGRRFFPGKIFSLNPNRYGYVRVDLRYRGKSKSSAVHRLVAEAFLDNPNGLPQINHKDENKSNNHVDNLEWCTAEYNINYGHRTEKMSHGNHFNAKVTQEQVDQIRAEYQKGVRGCGVHCLSKKYGLGKTQIRRIVQYESWK